MNDSIRPYLFDAVNLIKSNVTLVLFPTIIVLAPNLIMTSSNKALVYTLSILSSLFLIVIYPLIYGKFLAIINDINSVSWWQLFALHWWNYFIVKLVLYSPSIILTSIASQIDLDIDIIAGITSAILDILAIYIFPIVFMTNQRLESIPLGIKCLFGNFTFSLPLIIISVLPILFLLLPTNPSTFSENSAYHFLSASVLWISTFVIDFTVFIAAILILKDKIYRNLT